MVRLQVMTYAKREALEVLGAYAATDVPDHVEGVPLCHNCGAEIEATSDKIRDEGTAPPETLFCWDGEALLCAGCALKHHERQINDAQGAYNNTLVQRGNVVRDIERMTSLRRLEIIERYELTPIRPVPQGAASR